MGNKTSRVKITFENIQDKINNRGSIGQKTFILINTMPENIQNCLIPQTTPCNEEEALINDLLKNNADIEIIIYGTNNNDEGVITKYKQLNSLGFQNIFIYLGGMFEWLLLQDIYGNDTFPTTSRELDIMKYRPIKK